MNIYQMFKAHEAMSKKADKRPPTFKEQQRLKDTLKIINNQRR